MQNKTEQLAQALRRQKFNLGFYDEHDRIIELEYDRANPGDFPSNYVILGLKLGRKLVRWSVEPMFKPEDGDTQCASWRPGEKRQVQQTLRLERGRLTPILNQLGLSWGRNVSEIFHA